jgi:hypothetical protein
MIDPATCWFKRVKLPSVIKSTVSNTDKGTKVTCNHYTNEADTIFDKSSAKISDLVYKTWFSRYPCCQYLLYNNGSKYKVHFHALYNTYDTSVSQPVSRTHKQTLYWSIFMLSL